MKEFFLIFLFFYSCFGFKDVKTRPSDANISSKSSFYDLKANSIHGKEISFEQYQGKKVLIVNVASECGFTPQYEDLQELHRQHGDKVAILGFPANNFRGQEPGTNQQIARFCKSNYGVSFQMFEKISVKGDEMHPVYQWLTSKNSNGWNEKEPNWNFCKYLVNEKGELVKFYASAIKPMSEEIISNIVN